MMFYVKTKFRVHVKRFSESKLKVYTFSSLYVSDTISDALYKLKKFK